MDLTSFERTADLRAIFEALGIQLEDSKCRPDHFEALCPFHEESEASWHYNRGQGWYCFGCAEGGGLYGLIQRIQGFQNLRQTVAWLERGSFPAASSLPASRKPAGRPSTASKAKPPTAPFLWPYLRPHPEFDRRGVSETTRQRLRAGYLPPGKSSRFGGRINFPIHGLTPDGRSPLLGYTGRLLPDDTSGEDRWTFPWKFPRKTSLYGLQLLASYGAPERLYLVEGPWDHAKCLEAGLPACASLGTALTPQQAENLAGALRATFERPPFVWVFFDNTPNAHEAAAKAAQSLLLLGIQASPLTWHQVGGGHPEDADPGDLSVEELKDLDERLAQSSAS